MPAPARSCSNSLSALAFRAPVRASAVQSAATRLLASSSGTIRLGEILSTWTMKKEPSLRSTTSRSSRPISCSNIRCRKRGSSGRPSISLPDALRPRASMAGMRCSFIPIWLAILSSDRSAPSPSSASSRSRSRMSPARFRLIASSMSALTSLSGVVLAGTTLSTTMTCQPSADLTGSAISPCLAAKAASASSGSGRSAAVTVPRLSGFCSTTSLATVSKLLPPAMAIATLPASASVVNNSWRRVRFSGSVYFSLSRL